MPLFPSLPSLASKSRWAYVIAQHWDRTSGSRLETVHTATRCGLHRPVWFSVAVILLWKVCLYIRLPSRMSTPQPLQHHLLSAERPLVSASSLLANLGAFLKTKEKSGCSNHGPWEIWWGCLRPSLALKLFPCQPIQETSHKDAVF